MTRLLILPALAAVSILCCLIQLYAAGGLAAADISRRSVPVVGAAVGDQIEAWVLGTPMPDVAGDMPPWTGDEDLVPTPAAGTLEPWPTPDENDPECAKPSGLPVTGYISQGFRPGHPGIDIAGPAGTGVHSTMCGVVTYAGWSAVGYGYMVDVSNGRYKTRYAHLQSGLDVGVGESLSRGDLLGLRGSTGNSTGPHVHYEVWVDGRRVVP